MNFLSLNVRGVGEVGKTSWVRRLKVKHKATFVGLQETQLSSSSSIDVDGCWDSIEFDYASVDANGRSGGLISICDTSVFQSFHVIKNRHYLVVCGKYKNPSASVIMNIVNVYGPQSISEKKKVWLELLNIINGRPGTWVVFGDFNAVRDPGARSNSQFCPYSASDFNRFIHEANLKDYNMGGERFTYMSRVDAKLSKLDRFLTCPNYLQLFPFSYVTAHPRDLSDHSPITLLSGESDFGPIPFKFFNLWLLKEGFDKVVSDAWNCFRGFGTPDAYLAAKLRFLKDKIKLWRKDSDQKEREEVTVIWDAVKDLEKVAQSRPLSVDELQCWSDGIKKITECDRLKALDLKQKARIKWTMDGDENSKFFHGYINSKNRTSLLHGLMINGRWTTGVNEIKEEVYRFFHDKFMDAHLVRPKFCNPNFKSISMMDAIRIESPFTPEEVKAAVWDCGCEKVLGYH
ncbi:uncharacterized protein LOC111919827 [Lactuca sativa]|uniref:uncharacterized protein LOC111919827 n=1 Tax=Lactuca sativa TaxID=4236 RepID=UPI000CD9EDEF|nr:uncharacterized protein LOC111919827 [Lactuca sativa]